MTRARDLANLVGSGNYSSTTFTATAGQTAFTISHTQGFVQVFMNGLLLDETVDYTSNGTAITLTSGAAVGDEIEVVAYNTFSVGDAQTQAQADTRYLKTSSGGTVTGNTTVTGDFFVTNSANAHLSISDVIGEVGSGNLAFQAQNTAGSALKPMGFRAEDIRFATGNAERARISDTGLNVEGDLQGHNLNLANVKEWNITGSYSAGTDYVFSTRNEIQGLGHGNGFYKFMIFTDSYNAGLSHYSVYTPYSTFFFTNQACNTNVMQTLSWPGVNFGHAANTGNRPVDIKVHHVYSSDANYPANQKFIFNPLVGMSNLSGGAGYTMRIYLYKVA